MSGKERNGTGLGIAGLALAVPAGLLNELLEITFGLPGVLFCLAGLVIKRKWACITGFCLELASFLVQVALILYICIPD